ncbi:MAG: SigmaK-factor processing regulatory BofA [Firmicutes bacterium]|nr:SigmaK-factor processing regulatory BofA [Bacillota bacterium]
MPEFDLNLAVAAIFALIVLFYLLKFLFGPGQVFFRFVGTGLMGAAILFLFNLVGGFFNLTLGINVLTSLLVGYMGLPGLIMLIILQKMLG